MANVKSAQHIMTPGNDIDGTGPCTAEMKSNRKRPALNSRTPSPSGISTGSNNTETTGKSSRTSSDIVMPLSTSTKKYNSKNQCTSGDNNPETTQDVAVPKVILLGSGEFLNDTHETSEEISILNVTIARKEKLDLTNTSTDTSVTSVKSTNKASI
jgi:hypothetical protein